MHKHKGETPSNSILGLPYLHIVALTTLTPSNCILGLSYLHMALTLHYNKRSLKLFNFARSPPTLFQQIWTMVFHKRT